MLRGSAALSFRSLLGASLLMGCCLSASLLNKNLWTKNPANLRYYCYIISILDSDYQDGPRKSARQRSQEGREEEGPRGMLTLLRPRPDYTTPKKNFFLAIWYND